MRFRSVCYSILTCAWLVAATGMYGQEIRGSIVGNVIDSSGAAIPGCEITIKNEGTAVESRTTTDASGTYTVPNLLGGVYTVNTAKPGFSVYQATGIRLLSGQTVRQDITLTVGAVQQTVDVVARPQLVQTDSPTVGGTLQTRELSNLPFATTSTDSLFKLVPGMSQGVIHGNANPSIGGGPYYGSSNFTVNGVSTNNPGQGGGGNVTYIGSAEMIAQANLPSTDTLQEFKIDSSMNSAEYRSQTGVTMVTKQGTNRYHGTAYEFNENKATSANSFDFNAFNEDAFPFNRNQFGGNVGGPIFKDKLFFFVAYDGIREVHPKPASVNLPSAAMRNGDFSAICTTGFDANGVCNDRDSRDRVIHQLYNPVDGEPFAENQIPQSMITSQARTLLGFVPLPTDPTSLGLPNGLNWKGGLPATYGTNNEQLRLDGQLGAKDSVVGYFSVSRGLPWYYAGSGPTNYGNWPNHGYTWLNFSGTWTHTIGTGLVNELRGGWVYALRDKIGQNTGFQPWTIFPGMPASSAPGGGLPTMSISGYRGLGDQGIAKGIQNTVDWVDNLTWVHGRHTIKAGFEESGYKEDDQGGLTGNAPLGNFTFTGRMSGGRAWGFTSAGNAYADFLMGYPTSTRYGVITQPYLLSREWDGYVQDTWKTTPRLTVNFGVRYMYQRPWKYRDHNATFFDLKNNKLILAENSSTPTIPQGADPRKFAEYSSLFETTQSIGASLDYFHGDTNNWAPRVGFAYRLSDDNRTVIRGGYGVYYAFYSDWQGWRNLQSNAPWGATNSFSSKFPTNAPPDLSFSNAFPTNLITGLTGNPSVNMWDQNPLNPITQQWNLTFERQLAENWSLRATYLGSQTHHLMVNGFNINFPSVQQQVEDAQDEVLLQPWSSINYWGNGAKSNYHQLQLEAQKRFAKGLFFRAEYDWTRDLTNGDPNDPAQNPHDLRSYYGNDPYQFRHRFLIYYIYELPVGRGRTWLSNSNKFVDGVLGGWQVSGITTYHSGDPFGIYLEDPGTEQFAWLSTLMDRVPGPLYSGRQSGGDIAVNGIPWFNVNAFAPPQLQQWGNSSPNSVFGPGFGQWDLSIMKEFRLPHGETNRLQFKMDFINLPNHYNLGDPNNYIADERDGGDPDPTAGKIFGGANGYLPRIIQIGLKLVF